MAQPCIMHVLPVYYTNIHKVCNCTSKCEHNYTYIVIKWGNIFQAVCSIWGGSSLLWHKCNSAWQNWAFLTFLKMAGNWWLSRPDWNMFTDHECAPFIIASVCETQNVWTVGRPTLIHLSYSKELKQLQDQQWRHHWKLFPCSSYMRSNCIISIMFKTPTSLVWNMIA